jgi:hypothetical protein
LPILDRVKRVWNAFAKNVPSPPEMVAGSTSMYGGSSPSRSPLRFFNERSIIASIYTRISIDVAGVPIRHVQLDEKGRYISDIDSPLNSCFTLEPNIDQGPRAFRQDIVLSLFDHGVAVIVPIDVSENPNKDGKYDIYTMRVGEVLSWHPRHVRVNVYNDQPDKGIREEVTVMKQNVAIIENPLYAVMNETNSTLQRLIRKLTLLDAVDEQSSSGKLDVIIQLPYVIKSPQRREQAEQRREDIEFQLRGSQYGIAYIDGTEKVTQLNRPAENNLLKQIEYLTNMLYSELGLTPEVMNGTADEATMINYFNRTVKPILDAIVEAEQRTFLGALGVSAKQRIKYFRDAFSLVTVANLADIGDKLTRNEVLTSNELRTAIGIVPHPDPKADELHNSNMPPPPEVSPEPQDLQRNRQNGS